MAEKIVIPAGNSIVAPGILPDGDWMVEGLHKPQGENV